MSLRYERAAILNSLRDLNEDKFSEFCHRLTYAEDKPRIRISEVEDKSRTQITALLVSRCSSGAVDRTLKTLKNVGCYHEMQKLEAAVRLPPAPVWDVSRTYHRPSTTEDSDRQQPASGRKRSTTPPASEAAAVEEAAVKKGHFVDRHRVNLIKRVYNVRPILDYLLKEEVLQQEQYDRALEIRTRKDQMKFLYDGPLKSGGERTKDVLMAALCIQESFLMQDLWKNEGST